MELLSMEKRKAVERTTGLAVETIRSGHVEFLISVSQPFGNIK